MKIAALLAALWILLPATACGAQPLPVQTPGLVSWTGSAAADQGLSWEWVGVDPFDRAVLSWNATGPATFVLEVEGRPHVMGRWGDKPRSETTALVDQDTLKLKSPATAFKMRVLPSSGTVVTQLSVAFWRTGTRQPLGAVLPAARGVLLSTVPHFVQRDNKTCSPTAIAMVLAYHGVAATPETAAAGVRDHDPGASEVYGNWPFNTAYAHKASSGALTSLVRRMSGMDELERELAAARPTIVSTKPKGPGGQGHLVVVIGFTAAGDVVVHDPGKREGARVEIARARFYQSWLQDAAGIAYAIRRP